MHSIRKWFASKISTYRQSDDSSDDGHSRPDPSGAYPCGFLATGSNFCNPSTSSSARRKNHDQLLAEIARGNETILQFYYSDDELNLIASEMESFDGRRDPVRSTELIPQLWYAQEKVLQLLFQLMDEWSCDRVSRDYRQKYPEELLNDNENSETFNGQMWFSAECLAYGSDIKDREEESNMLRPLAKVLTNHLDQIRILLRQARSTSQNKINFFMDLIARLEHFDRLFTSFEFEYVKAMFTIKTVEDIEWRQDLTVLFSEAFARAIKRQLIRQSYVEEFHPNVMVSLPRLALVYGLIYCGNSSAILKRHKYQLPSVLREYHSLLHRIRHMLMSLSSPQILLLERMLADEEKVDNVDFSHFDTVSQPTTVKEIADGYDVNQDGNDMAVDNDSVGGKGIDLCNRRHSATVQTNHNENEENDDYNFLTTNASITGQTSMESETASTSYVGQDEVDISFWRRKKYKLKGNSNETTINETQAISSAIPAQDTNPSASMITNQHYYSNGILDPSAVQLQTYQTQTPNCTFHSYYDRVYEDGDRFADDEDSDNYEHDLTANNENDIENEHMQTTSNAFNCYQDDDHFKKSSLSSLSASTSAPVSESALASKHQSNCGNKKSIPDLVSRQLLHKLFISISSIAAQFQSNYSRDLSIILQTVFELHSVEEAEEAIEQFTIRKQLSVPIRENVPNTSNDVNDYSDLLLGNNEHMQLLFASTLNALENIQPSVGCDQASNASSTSETIKRKYSREVTESNNPSSANAPRPETPEECKSNDSKSNVSQDMADSGQSGRLFSSDERTPNMPPIWVPDELVSECSNCSIQFTLLRRRHHCRNCGFIFCNNCSNNFVQLTHFGYSKPVRVCNECYEG